MNFPRYAVTLVLLILCTVGKAFAHGDEPHDASLPPTTPDNSPPKFEAHSDAIELLGSFNQGALTLYLDDFATNTPLTGASVEINRENEVMRAEEISPGVYHATAGWANTPGSYSLIFIVENTQISDVLEATLKTNPPLAAQQAPSPAPFRLYVMGAALVALLFLAYLMRRRPSHLALIMPGLLCTALMFPRQGLAHGDEDHSHPSPALTSYAGDSPRRLPDGRLFIPKATQRLLSLRTQITMSTASTRVVPLNGHVIADPAASGIVQAGQAGRLEAGPTGWPTLGQQVKAGQVLAYLTPRVTTLERGNQQAILAELDSQLALAKRTRTRLESLRGSVAQKNIDAARLAVRSLQKRRQAIESSLYNKEALTAPVSGVIGTMEVIAGQVIAEGTLLLSVMQPDRLWVEALSYDPLLTQQAREASLQSGNISAKLTLEGSASTLRDQSIPMHFRIEAPVPPLPIGQAVTVLVNTRTPLQGILLPADAVTRNADGQLVVWVHDNAESFRPLAVVTEALDGQHVVVTHGLAAGLRVVNSGAGSLGQIR